MRVAFLTSEYVTEPNFDGGLANYLHRVSIALTNLGHQVEVFTLSESDETLTHSDILVHRVKPLYRIGGLLWRAFLFQVSPATIHTILSSWKLYRQFFKRHAVQPFDIVQAASYRSVGFSVVHMSPVPVVIRASSYEPVWRLANTYPEEFPSKTQLFLEKLERHTIRRASGVYAPSEFIAASIGKATGRQVNVIRPPFVAKADALDKSLWRSEVSNFRYLLFFGTISRLKGCVTLADALRQVLPRLPDCHVVLVGKLAALPDGTNMLDYFHQQAEENRNRIHYLGVIPHTQLYPVIEGAAAVVLPSLVDNLPNTCIEAMWHGKIVVGTRGASFEEMIEDGVSGFLVSPNDTEALANTIERVWQLDTDTVANIGQAAKARINTMFDPQAAVEALIHFYNSHLRYKSPDIASV